MLHDVVTIHRPSWPVIGGQLGWQEPASVGQSQQILKISSISLHCAISMICTPYIHTSNQ